MLTITCTIQQYKRNVRKLAALWGNREDDWSPEESASYCLLYMEGTLHTLMPLPSGSSLDRVRA